MRWFFYNVANPFIAIFMAVFISAGFALSLVTTVSIEMWSVVFVGTFLACTAFFVFKRPDFSLGIDLEAQSLKYSRRDRWIGYLPYLIFVSGFAVVFSNIHFQMVFDGNIHTSYVNEILVGMTPPDNPFLPGYPPNYYWLYHALLATVVNLTNLAPPLVSSFLNVLTLICILAWTKQTIRALGYGDLHPLFVNLLVIFVVFGLNLLGIIHALDDIFSVGIGSDISRDMVLMGDSRLRSLWFKFLAFNSFPLTIVYYAMGIFASAQLVKGYLRSRYVILILLSIVGGVAFNLGTGIFTVAVLPPALVGAFILHELIDSRPLGFELVAARIRAAYHQILLNIPKIDLIGLAVLTAILVFLMRKYYVGATESYPITGSFSLTSRRNLQSLVGTYYPIFPFFVAGLFYAVRTRNRMTLFMGLGAILGLTVSYLAVLRGSNQYKFFHLSSFFVCLMVIPILYYLFFRIQNPVYRRLGQAVVGIVFALVLINVSYAGVTRVRDAIEVNAGTQYTDLIGYDGRYLTSGYEPYPDAYKWLRENTPARTVVITPVPHASRLAMISARLPYAGPKLYSFVSEVDEYSERVNRIDAFFAEGTSLAEREQLITEFLQFDAERPLVFLIPHDMMTPANQLDALNLRLLFQGEMGDIYALRYEG